MFDCLLSCLMSNESFAKSRVPGAMQRIMFYLSPESTHRATWRSRKELGPLKRLLTAGVCDLFYCCAAYRQCGTGRVPTSSLSELMHNCEGQETTQAHLLLSTS
jgi:hypothetical protein